MAHIDKSIDDDERIDSTLFAYTSTEDNMAIKKKSAKNPPILSHEFIIQNHADIVSCVAMVFVVGLIFQVTAPYASMFVAVSHNASYIIPGQDFPQPLTYTSGVKDFCMIFFYFMICIVMHAIIQEYVLDKINRKLHLSKVKHSKFNESGQLFTFYLVSIVWGGNVILQDNYLLNVSKLWEGYPSHDMTFLFKFFYIIQICYWLHCYPELYFQKIKKEEMGARIQYATLYLIFITLAYVLNFTRIGLCLMVLHYLVECVFHFSRLMYFVDKQDMANSGFVVWAVLFVLTRVASIVLTVFAVWFGLGSVETETVDYSTGNFNSQLIRINCIVAVCLMQIWMMYNFAAFQLKRRREKAAAEAKLAGIAAKKLSPKKDAASKKEADKKEKQKKKEAKRNAEEDVNELTEVDQNIRKSLRSRGNVSIGKHKK